MINNQLNESDELKLQQIQKNNSGQFLINLNKLMLYSGEKLDDILETTDLIYKSIASKMNLDFNNVEIQKLIGELKNHLDSYYYDCDVDVFRMLSIAYKKDKAMIDIIDKYKKGLSSYMSKAIRFYCDENDK